MAQGKNFGEELQALVRRHIEAGAAPADLVDEMSKQVALVIDQNNLELEMDLRRR